MKMKTEIIQDFGDKSIIIHYHWPLPWFFSPSSGMASWQYIKYSPITATLLPADGNQRTAWAKGRSALTVGEEEFTINDELQDSVLLGRAIEDHGTSTAP
jgi:hypothetical protein